VRKKGKWRSVGGETPKAARDRLLKELGSMSEDWERADAMLRPYELAWQRADDRMRSMAQQRRAGTQFGEVEWFAALEERREAGHAMHPYAKVFREWDGWRDRLIEEIRNIDEMLEEEKTGKKPPPAGGRQLSLLE
jgi:hypothetical protein